VEVIFKIAGHAVLFLGMADCHIQLAHDGINDRLLLSVIATVAARGVDAVGGEGALDSRDKEMLVCPSITNKSHKGGGAVLP